MIPDLSLYEKGLAHPVSNNNLKRAHWHNYRSRCIYMITLMKAPGIPVFSFVKGNIADGKVSAITQPLRLGHHIGRALKDLPVAYPQIRLYQYALMPDHLHMLLEVKEDIPFNLGDIIRHFKNDCTFRYKAILKHDYDFEFDGHVFEMGFNDRILCGENQLSVFYNYLKDNPRRLYLKQQYPFYFNNVLACTSGNRRYSLYGNICLLEHPNKQVVRFSRSFSSERLQQNRVIWAETIRNGGVLVSPFIHPVERECLKMALENGGRIILIKENAFPVRWKPTKAYIDATAQGRMLFVGPEDYHSAKIDMKRALAMRMNKTACEIADIKRGDFSLSRKIEES